MSTRLEKTFRHALIKANRYDAIRSISQSRPATRDISLSWISKPCRFYERTRLEGGHVRLIKARYRVNKRQVDAVINDHYRRNIPAKEDHWRGGGLGGAGHHTAKF